MTPIQRHSARRGDIRNDRKVTVLVLSSAEWCARKEEGESTHDASAIAVLVGILLGTRAH